MLNQNLTLAETLTLTNPNPKPNPGLNPKGSAVCLLLLNCTLAHPSIMTP